MQGTYSLCRLTFTAKMYELMITEKISFCNLTIFNTHVFVEQNFGQI